VNPKDDFKDLVDGGGVRPSTLIHLGCYAILIVLLLVLVKSWSDERMGRAVADATAKTEKLVREEAKQERDKEVKELKDQMAQVKTAPQAVKIIERYIPEAAPVPVALTRQDISAAIPLPNSPSYTVRTDKQEIAVAQTVTDLQVCKKDFAFCEVEKASLTRERDEWKKAAKGGSRWKRIGSVLKWLGIGIGLGATLGAR
jgi:hypothetical protein